MLSSLRARLLTLPLTVVCGLTSTFIVIRDADLKTFALVSVVWSLALLLPFADLGTGAAVTNSLANKVSDRSDRPWTIFCASTRVLARAGLAILIIGFALAALGLWGPLLGAQGATSPALGLAAATSLAIFAVSLPFATGQRALLGLNRNDLAVWLSGLAPLSSLAFCGIIWVCGVNDIWYMCAQSFGLLIASGITWRVATLKAQFSALRTMKRAVSGGRIRSEALWSTAGPMLLISIGLPLALHSDRLVLSHRSDVYQLAAYSLVAQLYTPLWSIAASAGQPLWPKFARLRDSLSGLQFLWLRSTLLMATIAMILSVGLYLLGPAIVSFTAADQVEVGVPLLLAFGSFLLVQALQMPVGMFLTSEGGLKFQARCVMAMMAANLILSWWLSSSLGAAGPVVASTASILLCQLVPGALLVRRVLSTPANSTSRSDRSHYLPGEVKL